MTAASTPKLPSRNPTPLIALASVGGALVLAGWLSPLSLLVVVRHGAFACGIALAATGLGLWIVRALGLHGAETRWQLLLAAGLGLGAFSLLMLGLGLAGVMQRPIWLGFLAASAVSGFWPVRRLLSRARADEDAPWSSGLHWLWLAAAVFGALALVAATFPPGILWEAEGKGYDVLEYHLGVPREYFEAGYIAYLPHNIYSNFPFNVEMLYLLTMVLHGDPLDAVFTAQMLNVLLAALATAAIWLAGCEFGRAAGLAAGLAAATCPFLTYLCGVAYVENGMLFWTALALAATLRAGRTPTTSGRWWLAAGLACGLACGCKYTALPMVFTPLLLTAVWHSIRHRPLAKPVKPAPRPVAPASRRWYFTGLILFLAGSAAVFTPWLIKNVAMTGNPLFPLARGVFPERPGIWNDDGATRWHEGHLPAPEDRPLARRLARLWQEVLGAGLPPFKESPPRKPARRASEGVPSPPVSVFIRPGECRTQALLVRDSRSSFAGSASAESVEDLAPTPTGGPSRVPPARSHHTSELLTPAGSSFFGPLIGLGCLLGLAAILVRLRRPRQSKSAADGPAVSQPAATACWLMMIVGVIAWLSWTHLVGRFAVTLIAPAAVLLGVGWEAVRATRARKPFGVGLTILLAYHTYASPSLVYPEMARLLPPQVEVALVGDITLLPASVPHLKRLNELANSGRRVLMVGDARRFYLRHGVAYCVVFNRNPFAEAAADRSPKELLAWLREQGYDYVYVDWLEMNRLRSTRYGFWASIDADLFDRLMNAGLRLVDHLSFDNGGLPYGTLYEVPPGKAP